MKNTRLISSNAPGLNASPDSLMALKALLGAALLSTLSACASQAGHEWQADTTYQLTVLHTNDHHGRFWQSSDGEYGMSARKTLVDRVRAEVESAGGSVLLLSGGDINTGSTMRLFLFGNLNV